LLRRYQELLHQHGRGALHPERHPPGKTPARGARGRGADIPKSPRG
jgi:hypothetical protein